MKKWIRPWIIIPFTCVAILTFWSVEGIKSSNSSKIGAKENFAIHTKMKLYDTNESEDIFSPVIDHNLYSQVDVKGNQALSIATGYLKEKLRMKEDKSLTLELGKYTSPALGLNNQLVWKVSIEKKAGVPMGPEPILVEAEENTPHKNTDHSWLLVDCKSGEVLTLFTAGN